MSTALTVLQQPKTSFIEAPTRASLTITTNLNEKRYTTNNKTQLKTPPPSKSLGLPRQSWDCHMHVVEPQRYPVSADAIYHPARHTLREALAFESTLGIENIVLVQPSIYGIDNSCLLDALKEVGPSRGRGVVVVDPTNTSPRTLKEWHTLGVRGVRVNLKSVGKVMDENQLTTTLVQHADAVRPLGWVVQVYLPLHMVPMLEKIVPRLDVRVCIDHYGGPDLSSVCCDGGDRSFDPYSLPGFSSLVALLRRGDTFVKISAPYRFSRDCQLRDIRAITMELLRVVPDRVVFATDWPHTRFDHVDIKPFADSCLQWCGNRGDLVERVFRRNAEEMLDAKS